MSLNLDLCMQELKVNLNTLCCPLELHHSEVPKDGCWLELFLYMDLQNMLG